ncbi:carbon monoxide dehydrogenase subunit G [Streptomyces sp. BV286]|uniref:SRPBCC family protein n=1 Tax=Streptomyces sp. BV286 TaxID=2849672 RepID=UPI001C2E2B27|nr:SRPBCC domain-containing protein [Streptomyces sp. BV286]MBV1940937.1 carbon monoxide dehydrogenase subunit G [Streptomyces sp. BV286]
MEHEVFVPVSVERLREALADPARVARALPGLHQDAGTTPVSGRLKVRIGSHSITYRGTLGVSPRDDGSYAVEADATEARGSGSVKLALTLALRPAEGGSTLTFTGTVSADGRVTELPTDEVTSAATRLLTRFAEHLATTPTSTSASTPGKTAPGSGPADTKPRQPETPSPSKRPPAEGKVHDSEEPAAAEKSHAPEEAPGAGEPSASGSAASAPAEPESGEEPVSADEPVSGDERKSAAEPGDETELPPSAPVPFAEGDFEGGFEDDDATLPPGAPAEAAHARRTMIGRSAEEVDHAPPRGRYAPVPAPESSGTGVALRWAAPAAAFVVASAIVVGRVLRKRR